MSAAPGWYPDPGGQPRVFRYWDGRAWSASTTDNPSSACWSFATMMSSLRRT